MNRIGNALVCMALCAALLGNAGVGVCAIVQAPDGSPAVPAYVREWMAEINSLTLSGSAANTAPVGRLVCVLLEENPTTPYWWRFEVSDETALTFVYDRYQSDPSPEGFAGVGGWHAYYFRVNRTGTHTIHMKLSHVAEAEDVAQEETYTLLAEGAQGAIRSGLLPKPLAAWMAEVAAAADSAGLAGEEGFQFRHISGLRRYLELPLADGLVLLRLNVSEDLRPVSVDLDSPWQAEPGEVAPEDRAAALKAALLCCMAVTDSALDAARAEELASVLSGWVQEALERNVNMGHDEAEGGYYYSAMADLSQQVASLSITDYPVFGGTFLDGMDVEPLDLNELTD